MIYNFGVHLEYKADETESSSPSAATFYVIDPQTKAIRLLTEQVASLTASIARNFDRGNREHDRYRPRYDNDRCNRNNRSSDANCNNDRDCDTRVCDGCGEIGHVLKYCPTYTDLSRRTDRAFPVAFPVGLFTLDLDHSLLWVDTGANSHYSAFPSDFLDLAIRNDLGTVSGIDCPIRGFGIVFVTTVDSVGDLAPLTLLDVRYVRDPAQRSSGTYLRLLSVRMAVDAAFNCNFTSSRDFTTHSFGLDLNLVRHPCLTWLPSSLLCTCSTLSYHLPKPRRRPSSLWPSS